MTTIETIRKEIERRKAELVHGNYYLDNSDKGTGYLCAIDDILYFLDTLESNEPTLTWGDVQLLDTFILECAREEREGKDWGESEEFYTEVLRRYNDFTKRTIPEIVSKIHEYNENDSKDPRRDCSADAERNNP